VLIPIAENFFPFLKRLKAEIIVTIVTIKAVKKKNVSLFSFSVSVSYESEKVAINIKNVIIPYIIIVNTSPRVNDMKCFKVIFNYFVAKVINV